MLLSQFDGRSLLRYHIIMALLYKLVTCCEPDALCTD